MEQLDTKLAALVEKLQEAGFAQAPEVIDGAIRAIHWNGVVQLGAALAFAVGALIGLWFATRDSRHRDTELLGLAAFVMWAGVSLLVGLVGNPWLKAFDPEAAFYYKLLSGLWG